MYQYQYVTVIGEGVSVTKFREHRELIDRYAAEGWRYVGFVPTHISRGEIVQMDLVFEKAAD
ncbi:DUF4177 domain-containing protein [Lawsonibacter celer]|jgi:hypothetical protein|uniref:DUF4177 domain-containing protein n=1 Tax=Lawsonibacter celer TaxID=2986526 RepID=UPI0016440ECC|nr:DUF4177 domain-containing protein [Lawsonibacter celer]